MWAAVCSSNGGAEVLTVEEIPRFGFREFALSAPDDLETNEAELMELWRSGRAWPHIGAEFGLAEAATALRHVADGKAIGEVVLNISQRTPPVLGK